MSTPRQASVTMLMPPRDMANATSEMAMLTLAEDRAKLLPASLKSRIRRDEAATASRKGGEIHIATVAAAANDNSGIKRHQRRHIRIHAKKEKFHLFALALAGLGGPAARSSTAGCP